MISDILVKYFFRLSMSHHTLSDLTPKNTLTSPSDHHSVAVVQDVSRERTPKRVRAAAETNPTKRRPIITVLILNKYQNGIIFWLILLHVVVRTDKVIWGSMCSWRQKIVRFSSSYWSISVVSMVVLSLYAQILGFWTTRSVRVCMVAFAIFWGPRPLYNWESK